MAISFLDIPQGPEDLTQGQRYRIRVAIEFVGVFTGVREDGQYVFQTKGKLGHTDGSGNRDATRTVDPNLIIGIGTTSRKRTP